MMVVETNNGRNIVCDEITFEVKQTGHWVHLYRDSEDGKYEYEMIHISTIIRIYDYNGMEKEE